MVVCGVLAGCSQIVSEPEPDPATELAMEACSIEKIDDADPDSDEPTYTSFKKGDGAWNANDPVTELEELSEGWKDDAVAAEAAAQLDETWTPLAEMMAFQYAFTQRVVDERNDRRGAQLTPSWFSENWPDFNEDVRQFNENLDSIETTCAALVRTLEVTG